MPFGSFGKNGGGGVADILKADSVQTVGTTLLGLDVSSILVDSTTLVYVGNETFTGQGSVHDYFAVRVGAGLTTIEGEVYDSTTDGTQYQRLHIYNALFCQQTFVGVTFDSTLGTDIIDNDGFGTDQTTALAHPISMREANRRRADDATGLTGTVQVFQRDNQTANVASRDELNPVVMSNWKGGDQNAFPIWQGVPQETTEFTVTAYAAANPTGGGGGTGNLLSAVGIGTFATGGQVWLQRADGGVSARIQSIVSADQIRLNEVNSNDIVTGDPGAVAVFAVNDVVQILAGPELDVYPWLAGAFEFPAANGIQWGNPEGGFVDVNLGVDSVYMFNCLLYGGDWRGQGSGLGLWSNNTYALHAAIPGYVQYHAAVSDIGTGTPAFLELSEGYPWVINGNIDLNNSLLVVRGGKMFMGPGVSISLSMFNCTTPLASIVVERGGEWTSEATFVYYGNGNTCALMSVSADAGPVNISQPTMNVDTTADNIYLVQDGPGSLTGFDVSDATILNSLIGGRGIGDPVTPSFTGCLTLTAAIATGVASATSYAANAPTNLLLGNNPNPQSWPTSQRRIRRMWVNLLEHPVAEAFFVTLFISGVGTGMMITVEAADPPGTLRNNLTNPVQFNDGDTIDVQLFNPGGGLTGLHKISIMLES